MNREPYEGTDDAISTQFFESRKHTFGALVAIGTTNGDMAAFLGISISTVIKWKHMKYPKLTRGEAASELARHVSSEMVLGMGLAYQELLAIITNEETPAPLKVKAIQLLFTVIKQMNVG
jgi:hypothetical protein